MGQSLNAPGPEIPVIDESRLISEFGEDAEVLNELRDLFLQHVPPLYETILEAVAKGDCSTFAKEAHSLKGACATFGAPRLAMVCLEFEKWGKAGDCESAGLNLELLTAEYKSVLTSLGNVVAT